MKKMASMNFHKKFYINSLYEIKFFRLGFEG